MVAFHKKKQCEDENLASTKAALTPALLRTQLQALEWNQDIKPNPVIPSPLSFRWTYVGGIFTPNPCT